MDVKITTLKKLDSHNPEAYCFISGKQKVLGSLIGTQNLKTRIKKAFSDFQNKILSGSVEVITHDQKTYFLFPLSKQPGLDREEQIRITAYQALRVIKERSLQRIAILADKTKPAEFRSLLEGLLLSDYKFSKYKSKNKNAKKLEIFMVAEEHLQNQAGILKKETEIINNAVSLCRDLVNAPGADMDPSRLSSAAKKAAQQANIRVSAKTLSQLKKEGFNGLITVGKGSRIPPCMLTLTYRGKQAAAKSPHLILLGKGVTFDTGGINLKPGSGMWEMKSDMAGAATVLSALYAIAQLKLKINVSAVMVLAENRPGLSAVLPGDIMKAKNGKTVMVENTDAEGRLILTDGLAQAGIIGATHIVDLATLTGAIVRAIGTSMAGIFANDQSFARYIKTAGKTVGEKYWEMPLEAEYRSQLDDPVADLKNVGKAEAGAITAALFLQEFVPDKTTWCHIDIAGTAFCTKPWKYYPEGATGFGVKTLVALAKAMAK